MKRFLDNLPEGVIYKPLTWGVVELEEGCSGTIYASQIVSSKNILDGVKFAPGIYQARIAKYRDIRVTIFGEKIFAVAIDSSSTKSVDVRRDLLNLEHTPIILPEQLEISCRLIMKKYNLLYGAIDLIETKDGEYLFLELNPNGQWGWIEKKTGLPLSNALADLLIAPHI